MKKFSVRRLLNRQNIDFGRGTVADLAEKTGIHPNTAGKYFNGIDLQAVHLDVLTRICDYLVKEFEVDVPLPGALFYDDSVWNVLKDLDVTFFMGANRFSGESPEHEGRISRHDHRAQSLLAAHLAGLNAFRTDANEEFVSYLHHGEKDEVLPNEEDKTSAENLYRRYFAPDRKLKGTIIVASQKANLITELFVADCYDAAAFTPTGEPKVPFYLVPRDTDGQFISCFGGANPPNVIERSHAPGIHYPRGKLWNNSIEWIEEHQDAGVVLLRHFPAADVLDVAIFGFSGIGTYLVAKDFVDNGDAYWGFHEGGSGPQIGLYLCEIALADLTVRKRTRIPTKVKKETVEDVALTS